MKPFDCVSSGRNKLNCLLLSHNNNLMVVIRCSNKCKLVFFVVVKNAFDRKYTSEFAPQ